MKRAGTVPAVDNPHLQMLLDKQACAEVMMTYCRAVDHRDEELLRSVFHPGSQHRHGFIGPSSDPSRPSSPDAPGDFVAYALAVLATHIRTHHQLGNIFVEVEPGGTVAYTEAYFTAFHRQRPKGDPQAAATAFDTEMDVWVGGRYMDRMEKRDNVWKITHRTGLTDWRRVEAPASLGFGDVRPELRMQQNRDDFLFHRRAFYG
ncbi:MAG: nuclear transport factor 2 family protein [Alphaproteobacteria bacterium]|nr:nuclear transport factor 2 family protein [Alphaproteobacteria bacterium]